MKTLKNTLKITIALMALTATSFSYAVTYTTLTDGDWNNTTNVWSTDGVTPCGCFPGYNINNKDIIVNHNITTTGDLKVMNASTLTVNTSCFIGSDNNIIVSGSVLNIYGSCAAVKLTQSTGSTVNLIGATITLYKRYEILAGTLNMDSSFLTIVDGNFDISAGAGVNVANGSFIVVANGNIKNSGTVSIDAMSCVSCSGVWRNDPTGIVAGNGSTWAVLGNMMNENIWDPNIVWCSTGNATGMTSPEDCSQANNICINVILPVELVSLEASASDQNSAKIYWSTASERNSSYFSVMKLVTGEDWEEIARIPSAENSTTLRNYSTTDNDYNLGDVYYRLIQVDLNGAEFYSDIVSVSFEGTGTGAYVYPNPVNTSEELTISNLSSENSIVTIISLALNVVTDKISIPASRTINLSMEKLQSGLYFVKVEQQNNTKTIKLVVTD